EFSSKEGMRILTWSLPPLRLLGEQVLDAAPDVFIDDRRVQPLVNLSLMSKPSGIDGVRQNVVDMASADQPPTRLPAGPRCPNGQTDILRIKNHLQPHDGADV